MGLSDDYRWAAARLRACGYPAVAERLTGRAAGRGRDDLDSTPMSRAIMAALDVVDCRRAAALDPVHARRWEAIAKDQAEISRAALAFQRVEVER